MQIAANNDLWLGFKNSIIIYNDITQIANLPVTGDLKFILAYKNVVFVVSRQDAHLSGVSKD